MALCSGNRGANVVGVEGEVNRIHERQPPEGVLSVLMATKGCALFANAIRSETMSSQGDRVPLQQGVSTTRAAPDLNDYPVREYVTAMALELARMARWDGDEVLAGALEAASAMASRAAK
ncbi:hypothetical protein [Brevundimonas sp.]|uniref:hypothetical protein n=1 Tax=Brevundimonas sp. TaxID=1871086 RepID=UPI002EDAF37D